ncbi:DUF928 domain-containing protein [Acaryochloris sp. IP29b_bin.148]|uniref:DUF928 domain-containing protein n=1 Tax=Acaryochloris sp. IP29b_bin.148 TaxID=2969218 RepID=UPI0026069372|nr:DUF928 domain-containing protein [Acaryochloris sp. IP29b_bin.148]
MSKYLRNPTQRLISSGVMGTLTGAMLFAWPSYANFKPPGDLEKPGNRRGLATRLFERRPGPLNESTPRRGPARVTPVPLPSPEAPPLWDLPSDPTPSSPQKPCVAGRNPTLTTLVPNSNIGLTASAAPTFYWYTPTNSYKLVQFSLFKMDPVGNPLTQVYTSTLQVSGKAGLSSVTVLAQETTLTLEPGTDYRWQVGLYCSPNQQQGIVANGWIRFVPPPSKLVKKLVKADARQTADLYAEAGYWYDAVHAFAIAQPTQPQEANLTQAWQALLTSDAVQLPEIAACLSDSKEPNTASSKPGNRSSSSARRSELRC